MMLLILTTNLRGLAAMKSWGTEMKLASLCFGHATQDGIKPKEFTGPLQWWEEHKNLYPTIYVLPQRFLSIPATSAPSEQFWSLACQIITIRWARIASTILGGLMYIKENSIILNKHFSDIAGK
jgi:hypothetical protein